MIVRAITASFPQLFIFAVILGIYIYPIWSLSTVYVDSSGSLDGTGTIDDPCSSLRCGLNVAENDAFIYINPGLYTGVNNTNLCDDDSCALSGVKLLGLSVKEDVIISCSHTYNTRFLSIYDNSIILLHNMTVRDCVGVSSVSDLSDLNSGGGAILCSNTNITIQQSAFVNNSAYIGGALMVFENSTLFVSNSVFLQNEAYVQGGAICLDNSWARVVNNSFIGNNASSLPLLGTFGRGGAIYFNSYYDDHKIYLHLNSFYGNLAHQGGGAIFFQSISLGSSTFVSIRNTYIQNRAQGLGQCVSATSCDVQGGALFVNSLSSSLANDVFIGNSVSASNPTTEASQGGAICLTNFIQTAAKLFENSSMSISDCIFSDNYAGDSGGAIFSINQRLHVDHCNFTKNMAGSSDDLFSDVASSGGALWYSGSYAESYVRNSSFDQNLVYGGWGAGIYATESSPGLVIQDSSFILNTAKSSYTYSSQGGAIMASRKTDLTVKNCYFYENSATPRSDLIPLTYSGFGGALFVQSASANVADCIFKYNFALTGQFDVGASGGAIVFIDVIDGNIQNATFTNNGAAGYFGFSSYASSGAGGAIMTKFSTYSISYSTFTGNWVSAGGMQISVGGAIAMFYEPTDTLEKSRIQYCSFLNNSALSQTCYYAGSKSGQGGAISVVGASYQGLLITHSNFTGNVAMSPNTRLTTSFGGGIAASYASNLTIIDCNFKNNSARHGAGSDIASLAEATYTSVGFNTVVIVGSYFKALTLDARIDISNRIQVLNNYICTQLNNLFLGQGRRKLFGSTSIDLLDDSELSFETRQKLQELRMKYQNELQKEADEIKLRKTTADIYPVTKARSTSTRIGVLATNGYTYLVNPTFASSYHVFFGDIGVLLSKSTEIDYYLAPCVGSIYGKILSDEGVMTPELILTGVRAEVAIANTPLSSVTLNQIHLLNCTLYVSNNMTVVGNSSIISSSISTLTLSSQQIFEDRIPVNFLAPFSSTSTIRFRGYVVTGFGVEEQSLYFYAISDDIFSDDANGINTYAPRITLVNVIIMIYDVLQLSAVVDGTLTSGIVPAAVSTDLEIIVSEGSAINITSSGIMKLLCSTSILADTSSSSAVFNSGNIYLAGEGGTTNNNAMLSINSKLTVFGAYEQTSTGTIHLSLNETSEVYPILNFSSNASFYGTVNILFLSDPELILYSDSPSRFSIATYTSVGSSLSGSGFTISAPSGLTFSNTEEYVADSPAYWTQVLTISGISCESVMDSYDINKDLFSTQYPCYICLLNSSCTYCGTTGQCVTGNSCPSGNSGSDIYTESCCPDNCNSPNGNCHGKKQNTEFQCDCNEYYQSDNCSALSFESIILITTAVFLVSIALVTYLYYRYSRHQKLRVLEELRRNLLGKEETGKMVVDSHYIQSVRQDLILKDVFVKYEEINIENIIGEGSFGVVFKATFRGAQVAVKQMRSVLMEITEREIEEFKKEAYVMSRLRHPNIVLVMGISLVDQEVKVSPKKNAWKSDEDDAVNPYVGTGVAKKLPQTICIVTEYLEQGSLADILYGPRRLPAEVWTYDLLVMCALQAARGMLYLHSHSPPICHRDLKSSNLVVDDHWVVKVTDFGMSRIVPEKVQDIQKGLAKDDGPIGEALRESFSNMSFASHNYPMTLTRLSEDSTNTNNTNNISTYTNARDGPRGSVTNLEMTSNLGTTAWCAPELLTASSKTKYSVKVDVYSFGMVLWELWEKKRPFEEFSSRFDIIDAIRDGKRPPISDDCPPVFRSLIQRCWQQDPSRRPTFQYVVKYLKEEVARIRRQKSVSTGRQMASSTASDAFSQIGGKSSPISQPDPIGSSMSSDETQIMGRLRKFSFTNPYSSPGSISSSLDNPGPSERMGSGLTKQWSSNRTMYQIDGSGPYPAGRAPLIASAIDNDNLRQLALSPSYIAMSSLTSSSDINQPSSYVPPKIVDKQPTTSDVNESSNARTATATSANTASTPLLPRPNPNVWRDKYVLKFSGWTSAEPDSGLPPSLASATASSSSNTATTRQSVGGSSRNPEAIPISSPIQRRNDSETNSNTPSQSDDYIESIDDPVGRQGTVSMPIAIPRATNPGFMDAAEDDSVSNSPFNISGSNSIN